MKHISIVVAVLMAALPPAAMAHATLDRAMPPVGSSQAAAPREVVLSFTEDLEPVFSTIEVRTESGAVVSSGKARVDPKQRTPMRVPLKSLPPGTYKVFCQWTPIAPRETSRSRSGHSHRRRTL
jgi:methionine-rich copper-binding protein CopC